ncbi:C39 family peptidase [Caldisalinibacter kiritimatiensis]|uniref:Peptidase M23B n=1 Tax=Caldisalinibacter kiritimatiensis TaxID=1304284 RepID=R1CPN9_9FIRM|nr:C39 family peptidase [Caldisalinibacter kiritimatiensis]EOD00636.1 peptidase M23B [Caldisalinibacter kiritimatiensis]
MKKIVSMLMIFALLLNIGTMVFANNEPVIIKDIAPEGEFSKYLDTSLNRSGSVGIQSVLNISLPVLAFDQHDPEWKDDIMETDGLSIDHYGCALTSVAMVFRYFGINTDPGKLNEDLGDYACPIHWYRAAELGSDGKAELVTFKEYPSDSDVINATVAALQDDNPVIVGFKKPDDGTHFVLVKSVIGDGLSWDDYGVIDPNGATYKNLKYYKDLGWTFHRLVIYDKVN